MPGVRALVAFFLVVLALEWAVAAPLASRSPEAVGVITLTPALAALIVLAAGEGRRGVGGWLRRCWSFRAPGVSWPVAIGVPVVITGLAASAAWALGHPPRYSPILLAFIPTTLVLAATEEMGWRGFALPRLLDLMPPLPVALLFGAFHAAFHLPMFLLALPASLRQASPFWLFGLMAVAYSCFGVAIFVRSGRNVPVGIAYHAAINTSVLLLAGVDRATLAWILPVFWVAGAAVFVGAGGLSARRLQVWGGALRGDRA